MWYVLLSTRAKLESICRERTIKAFPIMLQAILFVLPIMFWNAINGNLLHICFCLFLDSTAHVGKAKKGQLGAHYLIWGGGMEVLVVVFFLLLHQMEDLFSDALVGEFFSFKIYPFSTRFRLGSISFLSFFFIR